VPFGLLSIIKKKKYGMLSDEKKNESVMRMRWFPTGPRVWGSIVAPCFGVAMGDNQYRHQRTSLLLTLE